MQKFWQTQNTALAVTLATCGVPFAKDETGNDVPVLNIYDGATLKRLGYSGWQLEDAARDAFRTGKRGLVVYQFETCLLLDRILKAYDTYSEGIRKSETDGVPMDSVDVSPEDVARICCQFTKNRNVFVEGWRQVRPIVIEHGATRSYEENGRRVTEGSFKGGTLKE